MPPTTRKTRPLAPLWHVIAACVAGCAGGPRPPADLVPPGLAPSQAALAASLDDWKAGRRASGVLIRSQPAVGVVDSTRAERPLLDYEILGPLMVVEKARPFVVRLVLDAPREAVSARYLVMGRDPLWVFRQEDFERMLHWEHRMDPEPAPATPAKPAAP